MITVGYANIGYSGGGGSYYLHQGTYFGGQYTGFDYQWSWQTSLQCMESAAKTLIADALAATTYIKENWRKFASLPTAARISGLIDAYAAGEITAIEVMSGLAALLGAADWLVLLAAIGLVAWSM